MLTGLKDARFSRFSYLHTCILLVVVCRFGQYLGWRFSPIYNCFLSHAFVRLEMRATRDFGVGISNSAIELFEDAWFGPFSNLHTCISLVEVYWFGHCCGWRFSPISIFFSLVSSRTFRDAPHSRFRCGDSDQCLADILKVLLLALPQIYTRVFHLWKSIDLDMGWVGDSCT